MDGLGGWVIFSHLFIEVGNNGGPDVQVNWTLDNLRISVWYLLAESCS